MSIKKTKISKKTQVKPSFTYAHPSDVLDISQQITEVVQQFVTNNITEIIQNNIDIFGSVPRIRQGIAIAGTDLSSATLLGSINYWYVATAGTGGVRLPLASNLEAGDTFYFTNSSGNTATIYAEGPATILNTAWNSSVSNKSIVEDGGVIHKFVLNTIPSGGAPQWIHTILELA